MSKADKMFEELGYKVEKTENVTKYSRANYIIAFDETLETIVCNTTRTVYKILSIDELKAINEKCKELGWLDD